MIRGVVFDLDDTLYPERDFVRSGIAASAAWLEREHGVAGLFECAWPLFEAGERGQLFDKALKQLGRFASPDLIAKLIAVYRAHEPTIALAPEVLLLLERLHAHGSLALLTDGYYATQQQKVKALGLERWFRPIVYTDALGREHWKPSHKGFLAIQDVLGLAGKDLVYIADNPAKDFRGPCALGWRTIRLRRPGGEHAQAAPASAADAAEVTIDTLAELSGLDLLDAARRSAG